MPSKRNNGYCWAILLSGLVSLLGCSAVQLPAIDPSGERIFLPFPNSTSLVIPPHGNFQPPGFPTPAFVSPETPPPCEFDVPLPENSGSFAAEPLASCGTRLRQNKHRLYRTELIVSPTRIVAPIGGEVVLLAGLCAENGHFVTKQKIEWMLSQDSVGQILEPGPNAPFCLASSLRGTPKKLTTGYAITHTASKRELITRGTPDPTDDIHLKKGQTWVSLTSPTAGISHITVFAPHEHEWHQRRRTATVHWIDAKWQLPSSQVVPATEGRATISTKVFKSSNRTPATGWIVRFEILGDSNAVFSDVRQQVTSRTVTSEGDVAVDLELDAKLPETTTIGIQILRPGDLNGEVPEMVVGNGTTTITWTSPDLTINAVGPSRAQVDSLLTYLVDVSNSGNKVAQNISLSTLLPAGMDFVSSEPSVQQFGERLEWSLGSLPPRTSKKVTVNCRTSEEMNGVLRFETRADGVPERSTTFQTEIYQSALEVSMIGPKEDITVGQPFEFRITVSNNSRTRTLRNITLSDHFTDGLKFKELDGQAIEWPIGDLGPGQEANKALRFIATMPGRLGHSLQVTTAGGESKRLEGFVNATVGAAALKLTVRPAVEKYQNTFIFDITNRGSTEINQYQLAIVYPLELEPVGATIDPSSAPEDENILMWDFAEALPPGSSQEVAVKFSAEKAPLVATISTTLSAGQNSLESTNVDITIQAPSPADDPADDPADGQAETATDGPSLIPRGDLTLGLIALDKPVLLGSVARYILDIENDRNVPDQRIDLTLSIPPGLSFVKVTESPINHQVSPDGQTVRFESIQEMRPGDRASISFQLRPVEIASDQNLTSASREVVVQATSQRTPKGVEVRHQTTVNLQN